jgi:membrane protein DedA with SNARE-associated domain
MAIITDWVTRYGYLGIFSLLAAGIVGLPVPDETILTFSGYLVSRRILYWAPTISAALTGTVFGITVSYTLGRTAGLGLLRRYGRYLHITEASIDRTHQWFERIGRWTLLIGYFIPGVRHLTALVAGASRLRYRAFALFAYSGGLIWSLTFISVGFFFGSHWKSVLDRIHSHVDDLIMIALGLLLLYLLARWLRRART